MTEQLRSAVAAGLAEELDSAVAKITHCLGQLSEAQVWDRPRPDMNTVGNLLLHLTGNVKQWVVSGVGGEPDDRDRPAEFAAKGPVPKAELLSRLTEVVNRAKAAVAAATPEELCRVRRVQSWDVTGFKAALHSVAHFWGHTQEIIHMTRAVLGDGYRYAWVPANKAQGATA